MKLRNLVPLLMVTLSGCVSTKNIPLNPDHAAGMQDKSITSVSREIPDFSAMTAGKAMFAAVGAIAMISEGNEIIRENGVEDPADYISLQLMAPLATKYNLAVQPANGQPASSEDVNKLSQQYSEVDLLLDVRTINWSFVYFPTDWDNYRVLYSGKMRLIDTRSAQVVAEGFCSRTPEQDANSPTHEELLDNQATRLKSELRIAAEHCISEFSNKALNL